MILVLRFLIPAAILVGPTSLHAQGHKELKVSRHRTDQTALSANIRFAAGRLVVRPTTDRALYRFEVSYDPDRYLPVTRWLAGVKEVHLGLESVGRLGWHVKSGRDLSQAGVVELSPSVDLSLAAGVGAAEADLDLGGLRITDLAVRTGASRTQVHFGRLNQVACRSAVFTMEATDLVVDGLANSRCRAVSVEGDAGTLTLDFSGTMTDSMAVSIDLRLGGVTLRLPRDLGIRLTMDRFLARFDGKGFTRDGKTYVSPAYASSTRRVHLDLRAAVGGVSVEWLP